MRKLCGLFLICCILPVLSQGAEISVIANKHTNTDIVMLCSWRGDAGVKTDTVQSSIDLTYITFKPHAPGGDLYIREFIIKRGNTKLFTLTKKDISDTNWHIFRTTCGGNFTIDTLDQCLHFIFAAGMTGFCPDYATYTVSPNISLKSGDVIQTTYRNPVSTIKHIVPNRKNFSRPEQLFNLMGRIYQPSHKKHTDLLHQSRLISR